MNFPLFKTKTNNDKQFNLNDPKQRADYFQTKAGEEITKLKKYFGNGNTFIAYVLGKKNAGKGTYAKLFLEALGDSADNVVHISVGDIVRDVHSAMENKKEKKELMQFLKENYRGYISAQKAIDALLGRDTKTLLPNEFILSLVKREINQQGKKALFIDGFPRTLDQVSYSLYFRDLIDYRPDTDFFVLIDVPEAVIDERLKYRVICPKCHTSRNLKLLPTSKIGYDKNKKEFYLECDNPDCQGARMVGKEGDELGIENIRKRLEMDGKLIKQALNLYGVPKILLRNSVPIDKVNELVDDYEITPEYVFSYNKKEHSVEIKEKPWIIKDDQGVDSHSLLAPPVVVSFIKQMVEVLDL